jgi:hypothetical protein
MQGVAGKAFAAEHYSLGGWKVEIENIHLLEERRKPCYSYESLSMWL